MISRSITLACAASVLLSQAPAGFAQQIVCSGEAAGGYAAFPDLCRLPNGDLYCVCYSGYGHVSDPSATWSKGGRIVAVRSTDQGMSWTKPVVVIDTAYDDRDPSVACLKNGTLILNWFTPRPDQTGKGRVAILLARSTDQGQTWSKPAKLDLDSSARVRHPSRRRNTLPGNDLYGDSQCHLPRRRAARVGRH
jgi:hypothetical protein